jgi:hypothetical protein
MRISLQTSFVLLVITVTSYRLIPNTTVGGSIMLIGCTLTVLSALYVARQNRNKDR